MSEPAKPDLSAVKACLARELAMRKSVYARTNRMTQAEKDKELAGMAEALRIIESLAGLRGRLFDHAYITEMATLHAVASHPDDAFVKRHGLNPAHKVDDVKLMVISDILTAVK